jgi:hypothetical protein
MRSALFLWDTVTTGNTDWILAASLSRRESMGCLLSLHFTDGETKAPRGEVSYPWSQWGPWISLWCFLIFLGQRKVSRRCAAKISPQAYFSMGTPELHWEWNRGGHLIDECPCISAMIDGQRSLKDRCSPGYQLALYQREIINIFILLGLWLIFNRLPWSQEHRIADWLHFGVESWDAARAASPTGTYTLWGTVWVRCP